MCEKLYLHVSPDENTNVVPAFNSEDEILWCGHFNTVKFRK